MSLYQQARQRIGEIKTQPEMGQSGWNRFLRFHLTFWSIVNRRMWMHNAFAMSSALAYQTIFALIPVLVLSVLVLKSLGAIGDSKESVRLLLDRAGMSQIQVTEEVTPGVKAKGKPVALSDKIEAIFETIESKITVGTLGPVGVVLLIWSAVALLTTMEKSLNRVFGVDQNRSIPRGFFLYWSAMTLVPLTLTAASYLSREAMEATKGIWGVSWVLAHFAFWIGTPLVGILLLGAIYKFLPNTNVPYRTAIIAAVVAAPLWMIARWGFGLYVQHAANHLYGALGLIPVFLVWLNLSWLIFLFGMEVAYTVANLQRLESSAKEDSFVLVSSDLLATALVVARHYLSGAGPAGEQEIGRHVRLPGDTLNRVLERLQTIQIILPVESGENDGRAYVPARPVETIPLYEILDIDSTKEKASPMLNYDAEIGQRVQKVLEQAHSLLGHLTLADLVERGASPAVVENRQSKQNLTI
ncbi:MAG: YihY/virulence factor BrkB family protein [Phycisphaerae bacterium]